MKFILIQFELNAMVNLVPIIFPKILVHKHVAENTMHIIRRTIPTSNNIKVVSAGFYEQSTGVCYGESETLGIKCKDGTTELIRINDRFSIFDKNDSRILKLNK